MSTNGLGRPVRFTYTTKTIASAWAALPVKKRSYRAVAKTLGVTAPTLRRYVLLGEEPRDPHKRAALGLPLTAPAPVCRVHGVVHVGACPRQRASDYDAWRSDPRRARKLWQWVRWAEQQSERRMKK